MQIVCIPGYVCIVFPQLRERLSLLKVAQAEEEERKRKEIMSAKKVHCLFLSLVLLPVPHSQVRDVASASFPGWECCQCLIPRPGVCFQCLIPRPGVLPVPHSQVRCVLQVPHFLAGSVSSASFPGWECCQCLIPRPEVLPVPHSQASASYPG